jgi:hypothetical protein
MLLEALDAEELGAQDRATPPNGAVDKMPSRVPRLTSMGAPGWLPATR